MVENGSYDLRGDRAHARKEVIRSIAALRPLNERLGSTTILEPARRSDEHPSTVTEQELDE
jgi:hypothetical protein